MHHCSDDVNWGKQINLHGIFCASWSFIMDWGITTMRHAVILKDIAIL